MPTSKLQSPKRPWTPAELRRLPANERDAILSAAAASAQQDYQTDPQLTAFNAFGQEDIHGHSSGTTTDDQPR